MVFSSILFLFRFMPAAFLIYYLLPQRYRNGSLLVMSLIFYSWGEVRYFPIMIASILLDYSCSNMIEKHRDNPVICRTSLWISVIFNLGMLGFFKYAGFFARSINAATGWGLPVVSLTLPLGISFYTFQTMSYTIDVYWNKVKAERNIIDFGAFVVLFPQLIAGPIVRFTDINRELKQRSIDLAQIDLGVRTFILGLGSKVLIANNIGMLWTQAQETGFSQLSTPMAWMSVLAFALQLYFDFSGYSLMAIGLGRMLGFEFPQNFNYPFLSRSMTEFWRRWHMTLGSWFREYLYFPLGGSRKGTARTVLNLLIVWCATGFWHGAEWNYLLWGFYLFIVMILEKYLLLGIFKKRQWLSTLYIIVILQIHWMLFGVNDLSQLGVLLQRTFGFFGGTDWLYALRNYGVTFVVAGVFAFPALPTRFRRWEQNKFAAVGAYGLIVLLSVAYLVDSSYNPFLYFRF